ncbi:hypothetical protein ASD50_04200 [Mesorhizobium sp. Root552]|jgi:hypothetical protein|nr:hypothetical protein ASD50_04200 [Mesorhizobium sp. Root552]
MLAGMKLTFPHKVDTLGKVKALGGSISMICSTCNKQTMLDMEMMIGMLGADHGCLDADLRPYFFCTHCREAGRDEKNFSFIQLANAKPQGSGTL